MKVCFPLLPCLKIFHLVLVVNNWPRIDEARISVVTDGRVRRLSSLGFLIDRVMDRVKNPWLG